MDQTQREFLTEIEDLIEAILDDVDVLRSQRGEGRFRRELLDRIFRRVHSVKGLAVSIGFDQLSEVAHRFEGLLEAVRPGDVEITDGLLDTFEAAGNALSDSLAAAETGVVVPPPQELFDRIHHMIQESARASGPDSRPTQPQLPDDSWRSLTQKEIRHLVDATVEGAHLFVVKSSFALANFDEQFYRLKEKLAESGEVIAVSPAARSDLPGTINFRILYASQLSIAEIQKETADIEDVAIVEIANSNSSTEAATTTNSRPEHQQHAESSISNSIRVDLKELDALISLTHELFRNTTIAVDLATSQLEQPHRVALAAKANQIQAAFLKLETGLINLRMVSIDRVLKRAMRAGRAAARVAQKEIDFDIRGVDLRLDKHLSDAIADPLVHLVRNAVDHGIETQETRLGAGKIARGRVRIEALGNGNRIRVRVTDDGAGIDPEVVSRTAARLDLIDPDTTLDMERSLRLIFRPGFSTAPSTTNVSGRGVGLDVVETGVEQVGGEVAVWSECGLGSCFEIRLPVTFGLLGSLVVVSSEHRYCIDAAQVVNSARIEAREIQESEGAEVLQLNEQPVPVVWMRKLLGQPEATPPNTHLSVITYQFSTDNQQSPSKQIAIVVDGIEGPEEVLVRNLGSHAGRWQGVVGATELRNGSVAIVLDVPGLL